MDTPLSLPRRSGRLAAKSKCRAPNPTVQAQNVLMAKWGVRPLQPAQTGVDDAFDDYLALFGEPLSNSKREAIRMLFLTGCAINGIQLAEGVKLEV